jgi:Flp pilus assembly protein TadD
LSRIPAAVWIAVALTLALRIAYFLQIRGNPYFDVPIMDEGYHDVWAREIAAGDLTSRIPFFRAPLYPFLLGALYRVNGPNLAWIRGFQLFLGAVAPLLTWLLARRVLPGRPRYAIAAAFVVALDGILVYFEAELLLECLLASLGTGLLILLLRAGDSPRSSRWLAAGAVLGLFAITRPNVLLFAPVAFGFAFLTGGPLRLRARGATFLTLGTCLVVLPVTALNAFVGHDPTLVATQGGLNFFLGNNPEANGWSATAPSLFRIDWWGGYEDATLVAEREVGHSLRPSEVSDHWFTRGFAWWREHPTDAVRLTLQKIVFFLSGTEISNNRSLALFFREFAPIGTPFLYLYYAVMPLALLGAISVWRNERWRGPVVVSFALVYAITIVAFFVTSRYRVPLRPLLAILALEGVRVIVGQWRAPGWRKLALPVVVVFVAVAVNANPWNDAYAPSESQFYHSVAGIYHEQGNLPRALDYQLRAFELDPTYPEGNLNLGTLYMQLGRVSEAVQAFERERVLDPDDGRNLASLANAYDRLGRMEDAEAAYSAAEAAGLADPPALYNHGLSLERLGRPEEAERRYRQAVETDSTFVNAWINLGVLSAKSGRYVEAIESWERALMVQPGDERVLENIARARARLASDPNQRETNGGGS